MQNNELLNHMDKLHTTELGVVRSKRNLALDTDHVVDWCRNMISSVESWSWSGMRMLPVTHAMR
ncbi:DUF3781 domain-containing protein [Lachnotalea sp. AF33-28]|nr:DUF3781 domain-containing protein [Lachnotalea sp. AF33-28]